MLTAATPLAGRQRDRRYLATRARAGTRTGASEKVAAKGSCAPAGPGSSSAMPGTRARSSDGGGWERSGNHGRSQVRSAALVCSPVRGFICGNKKVPWWRAGGQGVAGSNPAVPT
jgi:hypothetical protein